ELLQCGPHDPHCLERGADAVRHRPQAAGRVIAYDPPQDSLNASAAFAAALFNSSSNARCSGVGCTACSIEAIGQAVMPFSGSPHSCLSACWLTPERSRGREPVATPLLSRYSVGPSLA